jgi:hypothetical protein
MASTTPNRPAAARPSPSNPRPGTITKKGQPTRPRSTSKACRSKTAIPSSTSSPPSAVSQPSHRRPPSSSTVASQSPCLRLPLVEAGTRPGPRHRRRWGNRCAPPPPGEGTTGWHCSGHSLLCNMWSRVTRLVRGRLVQPPGEVAEQLRQRGSPTRPSRRTGMSSSSPTMSRSGRPSRQGDARRAGPGTRSPPSSTAAVLAPYRTCGRRAGSEGPSLGVRCLEAVL